MDSFIPRNTKRRGPEAKLQEALINYLRRRDWAVLPTHGNEFQFGFPDLYCAHYTFGSRWIEVKNPESYKFTSAQLQVFPLLQSKAVGIWILCYCDKFEYDKLLQPPNWHTFLNKSSMLRINHDQYVEEQ